jgi:hypothetical protein
LLYHRQVQEPIRFSTKNPTPCGSIDRAIQIQAGGLLATYRYFSSATRSGGTF